MLCRDSAPRVPSFSMALQPSDACVPAAASASSSILGLPAQSRTGFSILGAPVWRFSPFRLRVIQCSRGSDSRIADSPHSGSESDRVYRVGHFLARQARPAGATGWGYLRGSPQPAESPDSPESPVHGGGLRFRMWDFGLPVSPPDRRAPFRAWVRGACSYSPVPHSPVSLPSAVAAAGCDGTAFARPSRCPPPSGDPEAGHTAS